jgi:hypothetical protein
MHHTWRTGPILLALVLISTEAAQAQSPELQQSMTRFSARLDSLEAGTCPTGPAVALPTRDEPAVTALAQLSARLERLIAAKCSAVNASALPVDTLSASDELAALRAAAGATTTATPTAGPAKDSTQQTQFVSRQRNGSVLNPEISATGDIRLMGTKDHGLEGDAHEFEVALQSTLDPYSTGKIFLTFEHDHVGVEEGYLYWTGLPGRIRADAGLFRQQVGDLNRWHLHALPESDYPLVYRRYLGEDGLGGAGLSLYTALPLSIAHGTHEIWLQGTTVESPELFGNDSRTGTLLGRLQNFWQLSRSTYGQVGFTALGGNGDTTHSRVLGVDLRLTWRPPNAGTRSELTFRAEGYRMHTDELGETANRYGAFTDLSWRASQRWILSGRYDYVETPGLVSQKEWQITPALTWWESEFVYLRLEGQHHHDELTGNEDRLLLQAVFAMGPHKHETY